MRFKGIGASEGAAVGPAVVFRHAEPASPAARAAEGAALDPAAELARFREGRARTAASLEAMAAEAAAKFGDEKAGIFEGYLEILMDDEIEEAVAAAVGDGKGAEEAVRAAMEALAAEFACMDGDYMRERSADILDLGRRLAAETAGREPDEVPRLAGPSVLVADDLSPAETVRLDLKLVLALAVDRGGKTSHVAILARSLGIPCVVGAAGLSAAAKDGAACAVDGDAGLVVLEPDAATAAACAARAEARKAEIARLAGSSALPAATSDDVPVKVCANLGSAEEAEGARRFGADGVGLFRTEFLFMDGACLPSEDEQFAAYSRAVELLEGRPLTIRTLDVGGDKDLPALGLVKEENPFLGYRAVRVGLDKPEILRPQLRAALRSAARGPVELMFPLVVSVDEVRALKAAVASCRAELEAEGVPAGDMPVGIMVETPAAALLARELARECDFFSIGTNDLTQYALAVDRGNDRIAALYDPFHPAVLRLIAAACGAAREAGIPVGMCGEFASDPLAVPVLLGLGLGEFSVAASRVGAIKEIVRTLDSGACRELAQRVLAAPTAAEARAIAGEGTR